MALLFAVANLFSKKGRLASIVTLFLHCRFLRGWNGKRAAWISIIGFAAVLFTYFGVNYVLSGLHSYANA